MRTIVEKAYAKINLSLDVVGQREDGYHLVRMVMQSVELHDTVAVEKCEGGIEISCNNEEIPLDSRNTAYRAAAHLLEKCRGRGGVRINIDKRIPISAGLAGGSSDAAAVYRGINRLFSLGMGLHELSEISVKTGADVPFCVTGGTALVEGVGEEITPLRPLPSVDVVLVNPGIPVSTAEVYGEFSMEQVLRRPDTELLLKAVGDGDIRIVAANMVNVLETVTVKKHKIIAGIKEKLLELGALGSVMSGSGSTVIGVFDNRPAVNSACRVMKSQGYECILTQMKC